MDIDKFQCRCNTCPHREPTPELQHMIDKVEDYFGRDIQITSGVRCDEHNRAIGGSSGSRHVSGEAVDFFIKGAALVDIYNYLDKTFPQSGLGIYKTHIHMDSRPYKARWDYTA
jgi:uncharacterized protein YcbK (DUF882 family)